MLGTQSLQDHVRSTHDVPPACYLLGAALRLPRSASVSYKAPGNLIRSHEKVQQASLICRTQWQIPVLPARRGSECSGGAQGHSSVADTLTTTGAPCTELMATQCQGPSCNTDPAAGFPKESQWVGQGYRIHADRIGKSMSWSNNLEDAGINQAN